jgi:hypothetical protein
MPLISGLLMLIAVFHYFKIQLDCGKAIIPTPYYFIKKLKEIKKMKVLKMYKYSIIENLKKNVK